MIEGVMHGVFSKFNWLDIVLVIERVVKGVVILMHSVHLTVTIMSAIVRLLIDSRIVVSLHIVILDLLHQIFDSFGILSLINSLFQCLFQSLLFVLGANCLFVMLSSFHSRF